jgi:hypothetical protein
MRFISRPPRNPAQPSQRALGQGLTEFALVLPVLLLVLLFALDFGRLFNAVVTLNNAVRIGANYAATHPYAWDATSSPNDSLQRAEYEDEITRELDGAACALLYPDPPGLPDPSFPDNGLAFGDTAETALTCHFAPITPLIGLIVGDTVPISSSAVFPIRTGVPGEAPPIPPCFNQTTVPDIEGHKIADADALILAASLKPLGSPTYTGSGPKNVARNQDPEPDTCADIGTVVEYEYKP